MLFSKEMEGRGILRFTQADQRVVYCLNDLCHLLGIKYSNKIRGELHNKYVYFLTVKENGKLIKMRFVDISNLNILSRFATDTAKAESFSKWFSEEIFPLSMKDDVFNLETITDMNVAMALLSEYEDIKFKVRQLEYKERKDKIYLDSMEELLGHKNMISLNVYYDDVFERGYPKGKFYAMLRNHGILTEDNKVSQEYLDNGRFVKMRTSATVGNKTTTIDVIFISKSGINLIEQLLANYEGEQNVNE